MKTQVGNVGEGWGWEVGAQGDPLTFHLSPEQPAPNML